MSAHRPVRPQVNIVDTCDVNGMGGDAEGRCEGYHGGKRDVDTEGEDQAVVGITEGIIGLR